MVVYILWTSSDGNVGVFGSRRRAAERALKLLGDEEATLTYYETNDSERPTAVKHPTVEQIIRALGKSWIVFFHYRWGSDNIEISTWEVE